MISEAIYNQWLDNLENGKYEQAKGQLRTNDNKYCCLGVLADTINPNSWEYLPLYPTWIWKPNEEEKEGDEAYIPVDTLSEGIQTELVSENDRGCTFKEIANIIRDHKSEIVE